MDVCHKFIRLTSKSESTRHLSVTAMSLAKILGITRVLRVSKPRQGIAGKHLLDGAHVRVHVLLVEQALVEDVFEVVSFKIKTKTKSFCKQTKIKTKFLIASGATDD